MGDREQFSAYFKFADDTYRTFFTKIKQAVDETPQSKIALVVIGEPHMDREDVIARPAAASAFSEISAIHSAIRLVGGENVALSVELPQAELDKLQRMIFDEVFMRNEEWVKDQSEDRPIYLPPHFQKIPLMYTLVHAMQNGIHIVGNDHPDAMKMLQDKSIIFNEDREKHIIDGVLSFAKRSEEYKEKAVVIHIGGSLHLSNMMGYTDLDMVENGGSVAVDGERNPFLATYPAAVYFNTAIIHDNFIKKMEDTAVSGNESEAEKLKAKNALAEIKFMRNAQNAIQIEAPAGSAPDIVLGQIDFMVREAAKRYHTPQEPQVAPADKKPEEQQTPRPAGQTLTATVM